MITDQVKSYLAFGAALAIAGVFTFQQLRISDLQVDVSNRDVTIAGLDARVKLLEAANGQCKVDVDRQNAAVNGWIVEVANASSNARAAIDSAKALQSRFRDENAELRKQKSTGDMMQDCLLLDRNLSTEVLSRSK